MVAVFFFLLLFHTHKQLQYITLIYNSLQVTVIIYKKEEKEGQSPQKYYSLCLPAFLDTSLPRGNVHERDSGPMQGAIPTRSHKP